MGLEEGEATGDGEVAGEVVDVSSVGDITAAISAESSLHPGWSPGIKTQCPDDPLDYAQAIVSLPSKPPFAERVVRLSQEQLLHTQNLPARRTLVAPYDRL